MVILAVAFPVKESAMWGDRRGRAEGEWTILHEDWVPVVEDYYWPDNSWKRMPIPAPGPTGRAFILNERQREIILRDQRNKRTLYFKEVPSLPRIAFDVFFVVLCGLGAAYIAHGRRSRPIGPSGGVGDSKLP